MIARHPTPNYAMSAIKRSRLAWRIWRNRGAARMNPKLWLFWIATGRYPKTR